jgi:hypothetical protein
LCELTLAELGALSRQHRLLTCNASRANRTSPISAIAGCENPRAASA